MRPDLSADLSAQSRRLTHWCHWHTSTNYNTNIAARYTDKAVDCIESAFASLATEPVVMPPILRLDLADRNGEVDVKTAYVRRLDSFAIKVGPGFRDNPSLGLPSGQGAVMLVLSARTGQTEAVLLETDI
jgi:ornithine cyclodeaminase/alanine dehydrogenase-like protein (mu-crystallin family)